MGKVSKIIKGFLSEAAGISFEVREWAKIIETHVDGVIQQEKDKIKSKQADTTKPKSQDDEAWDSWSYEQPSTEDVVDMEGEEIGGAGFTHFVHEDGLDTTDVAMIYGDELWINGDVLEDYPGIKREIEGKLFKVTFYDGVDDFDVVPTGGSQITSYDFINAIKEVVEDHMAKGDPFYTDDYDLVYATSYEFESEQGGPMDEAAGFNWKSWYTPQPKIDKVEINGKDYPEAYEKFKVDKWVIINSGRIEYDHWKSGYNDDGEYVVYLNMPMSSIGGTMLVHEIKHAYDDWNRMSRGAPAIRDGWEINNIYTKDFEKLVLGGSVKLGMLGPVVKYYYLGSKLEAPAYLENEYDTSMMGYRDTAKALINFRASRFLNKEGEAAKGLQDIWTDALINYDIPLFRKFPNVVDFLKYTEKYFNNRGRDILKRIDKMRYVHDKPMPKPVAPRVYPSKAQTTTPQVSKPNPNIGQKLSDKEADLFKQIEEIEDKIETLYLNPTEENKLMIKKFEGYLDYLYGTFVD